MDLLFLSKRIYLGDSDDADDDTSRNNDRFIHGGIIVNTEGLIRQVLRTPQEVNSYLYTTESEAVYDFGDLVLMPGLIDANVNLNEPGRGDWEGFVAGTKAAAAGGFTTIIDRPMNSLPATTTTQALRAKTALARGKIYVDVGFWGGLVPGNSTELDALLAAGVIGLQCTLCSSAEPVGNDFPPVDRNEIEAAFRLLPDDALLAFHAEMEPEALKDVGMIDNPKLYESYLRTRPPHLEVAAVRLICDLAKSHPQRLLHVMSLSSAEALQIITDYQTSLHHHHHHHLTCETCPHYLTLCAEDVPDCRTDFKTRPPIRPRDNQKALWQALQSKGSIHLITSDHSPATPGVKCLTYGRNRGDFIRAFPGISSLQLTLPALWTHALEHNVHLHDIHRLMCRHPAQLCGISSFKGRIAVGYDADFCIWDPDEEFTVTGDMLHSSNKATPYMGHRLRGVVHATVVRGLHVYQQYEGFGQPLGKVLLRKTSKKIVKFVRM